MIGGGFIPPIFGGQYVRSNGSSSDGNWKHPNKRFHYRSFGNGIKRLGKTFFSTIFPCTFRFVDHYLNTLKAIERLESEGSISDGAGFIELVQILQKQKGVKGIIEKIILSQSDSPKTEYFNARAFYIPGSIGTLEVLQQGKTTPILVSAEWPDPSRVTANLLGEAQKIFEIIWHIIFWLP